MNEIQAVSDSDDSESDCSYVPPKDSNLSKAPRRERPKRKMKITCLLEIDRAKLKTPADRTESNLASHESRRFKGFLDQKQLIKDNPPKVNHPLSKSKPSTHRDVNVKTKRFTFIKTVNKLAYSHQSIPASQTVSPILSRKEDVCAPGCDPIMLMKKKKMSNKIQEDSDSDDPSGSDCSYVPEAGKSLKVTHSGRRVRQKREKKITV